MPPLLSLPIPATAPAGASLTTLSPLPSEIITMIFQAYIDTTSLTSPHFRDLLCLDRRAYNNNVQRLYDKVVLHAGNAGKFYGGIEGIWALDGRERRWTQPTLADLCFVPKDASDTPRAGTREVWVTGELSLPEGSPVRYPKHYLIRRVNQVTFMDWEALSHTAAAGDIFSLWLACHPTFESYYHPPETGPATLFQHIEGSPKNVRLIFHPDLMDNIVPTISQHPWMTVLRSLYEDFAHEPEVCLPMPSIPPSPSLSPVHFTIRNPMRGILDWWRPARLTIHNANPCPVSDWFRYNPSRVDIFASVVEGDAERTERGRVEVGKTPGVVEDLIDKRTHRNTIPQGWKDKKMFLNFYNLHSDVAKIREPLDEIQQKLDNNGSYLRVGLYSRGHGAVCSMCGKGE
ncbi:hypothetical protein IAT38_006581 [Cryptococcus sp. DSM 104549]